MKGRGGVPGCRFGIPGMGTEVARPEGLARPPGRCVRRRKHSVGIMPDNHTKGKAAIAAAGPDPARTAATGGTVPGAARPDLIALLDRLVADGRSRNEQFVRLHAANAAGTPVPDHELLALLTKWRPPNGVVSRGSVGPESWWFQTE